MTGRSDLVDVDVMLRRETEKAWGFAHRIVRYAPLRGYRNYRA